MKITTTIVEDPCLLGCNNGPVGKWFLVFQCNVVPSPPRAKQSKKNIILGLLAT